MNYKIFLIIFLFSHLGFSQQVYEDCQMSKGQTYNYFIDPHKGNLGLYGNNIDRLPPTVVQNCRGSNGRYLAFGLGIKRPYISSDVSDVSFDGVLEEDLCHLKNTPVPAKTTNDKKQVFKSQYHMLRKCMVMELTHLDGKKIEYPENQITCKLTRKPNGKVIAEGDFCIINIQRDLRVAISNVLNPDCANMDYIQKNNIPFGDIDAFLQAYVIDEPSLMYVNNQIGVAKVRLSILPSEKDLPINKEASEDSARFPTQFAADIHMGKFNVLSDNSDNPATAVQLSLFVDNTSQAKCETCISPNDYQIPLAAEATLYEISKNKRTPIDSWYAGRWLDPFVKSQWQGLYDLGQHIIEGYSINENLEYELELTFSNPYEDFVMLTTQLEEYRIDFSGLSGQAGKDSIESLNHLNNLKILPGLGILSGYLSDTDIAGEYERMIQFFRNYSRNESYPPYYTQVCNGDNCIKTNSNKHFLKLKTRFKMNTNKDSLEKEILVLDIERDSPLFKSYKSQASELPEVVCN